MIIHNYNYIVLGKIKVYMYMHYICVYYYFI